MAVKGLSNIVYAVMTNETLETYGQVKSMPKAVKFDVSPKAAEGKFYADNVLSEQDYEFSEADVTVEIGKTEKQLLQDFFGYTLDDNGAIVSKGNSKAKYVAIGWKVDLDGGKYGYMWLLKGKFSMPTENAQTKGEGFTYGTYTLTGKFAARSLDGVWKTSAITGDSAATNWFSAPYLGTGNGSTVDKSVLDACIVRATAKGGLTTQITAARTTYDDGDATQAEVDTAVGTLAAAIAA